MFLGRPNDDRQAGENQSRYLLAAFLISIIPFLVAFLHDGLGFSLPLPRLLAQSPAVVLLASDGLVDILMDWNTACLAVLLFVLSVFDYSIRKNAFVPLLGIVYLLSGGAGLLHSLALDGVDRGQIAPEPLEAWAWFLGSLFLSAGLVLILSLSRGIRRTWKKRVVAAAVGVGLLALFAVWGLAWSFHSRLIPPFPDGFLGRPLELIPMAGYLWLGAFFAPSSARSLPRRLRRLLGFSLLPLFAGELSMALASQPEGPFFGGALFLRMAGFLLPAIGLCVDHVLIRQERGWIAGQNQFEMVAETASDGILTVGNGNRITYINRSAAEIFGYKPENLIGRHIFRLVPPAHRKTILADARSHLDAGEQNQHWDILEVPGLQKNGQTIILEASINEFFNRHRPSFVVILRNITERKKFQETLQSREQYHRSLIENSSELIGILDEEGTFRYASPSYERLMGYSPDSLQGRPLADLLHPADKALFLGQWKSFCASGQEDATEAATLRLNRRD
ncbi:MAG TPA: PAS domain S-box protein, partial [bacterium]|nr:PAS domain S-box protein [bacterium]